PNHRPLYSFPTRRSSDLFGFSVPWNVLSAIERISNFFAKYPRSSFEEIRYGPNVPGCLSEKHFRRSHPCRRRIRWTASTYTDRLDRKSTRLNSSHGSISY